MVLEYRFPSKRNHGFLYIGTSVSTIRNWGVKPPGILKLEALTKELHASNEKMQLLMEQVILGKQNRFGRSSEKMDDTNQISFREVDGSIVFFNEAEAVSDLSVSEPEDLELRSPKQSKRKGKKEADLSGLPIRRIDHYLSETELEEEFSEKG